MKIIVKCNPANNSDSELYNKMISSIFLVDFKLKDKTILIY